MMAPETLLAAANPLGLSLGRGLPSPSEPTAAIDANGVVHVSPALLLSAAIPLLCVAFAGHRFNLGLENTLLVGIVRSFVQLMILGFILHPIFVLGMDWPWLVFLYVLFMISVTTKESMSRMKYTYRNHTLLTFLAFLLSIGTVGAFAFLVVIRPDPLWDPQYVIPICGMLMGNVINGVSLTVNNLSTMIMEGGRREVELYLSFGASGWESAGRLVRGAISVGATPIVNSMNVIGLVSIPGMMTGQILGGSPVTEAAHYQILITWLIAMCTFFAIIANVAILYRVAFDAGSHILCTDRFIEIKKKGKNGAKNNAGDLMGGWRRCCDIGAHCEKAFACVRGLCKRRQDKVGDEMPNDVETQPISNQPGSNYGSDSILPNKIQIQSRRLASDESNAPFFRISKLQFSVPRSNAHNLSNGNFNSRSTSSLKSLLSNSSSPGNERSDPRPQLPQKHVLCTNLDARLNRGEIGIVTGPSGSGKSTLLRVLSGLTPMDDGDVVLDALSLASCGGRDGGDGRDDGMLRWREEVRYVTQYKVDIPGTPRDFIHRVASFGSRSLQKGWDDEMASRALSYLRLWGMGTSFDVRPGEHPYLDKEWKDLSGGESQRTILAIAMASQPSVLLMDEATSGLDAETEKRVEESVVEYARERRAVVLWVTHSEDIAERLLKR